MKAILFDLDGVFYQGEASIAGAVETLAWLRGEGIPHLFLTNTTSRPRRAIAAKLARMGLRVEEASLLTPPVMAAHWLQRRGLQRLALFVTAESASEFSAFTVVEEGEGVDAVVVGDLGERWDFATLNRLFRLLMSDAAPPLVALAMTRYWQAEEGLRLDVGPFIRALEYACGRDAVVMGKPGAPFFHYALDQLGVTPQQTVMIGDDIRGDIEGAQRLGLKGVLVRTGKFRPSDLTGAITPYAVLDSIAELPAWWSHYPSSDSSPT